MITDDAMEVRADLRLLDWITNRDYCHRSLPMSGRSGKGSICSGGQEGIVRASVSKTHP